MLLSIKLLLLTTGALISSALNKRRREEAALAPAPDPAPAPEPDHWLQRLPGVKDEASIAQNLGFSCSALGLCLARALVPVPGAIIVPLLGASSWPVVVNSLDHLRRRERVGVALLDLYPSMIVLFAENFLAVALTSSAYHLSRKLLVMTEERSTSALVDVFEDRPQSVWILADGVELERPLDALRGGELVVIGAGEVIPIDGVISEGSAWVDQRALTGESQPAELGEGDSVFATTLVVAGRLLVRTEQTGADTTAARIGEILQRTDDFKSKMLARGERIIDQGSWPTIGLSVLAGGTLGYKSALAMNYAAIGYSARIGVPLSILNFLRCAAEANILVKDGRSLELLGEIDTIVFDKTGTLTDEVPTVLRVLSCGELDEDRLLAILAAIERRQHHPIARAVLREVEARGLAIPRAEVTSSWVGFGLQAEVDGQRALVGSARLMATQGVELSAMQVDTAPAEAGVTTLVYIALDGELRGVVELGASLRPGAAALISTLRERGQAVYILSGDHEAPTRELAAELGVSGYFAEALPQDKAAIIEELAAEGRKVCFVGDGINDAIALKKAHVSVSISGSSTVALDTAAVVLLDGSLDAMPGLFDLAERMQKNLDRGAALAIAPGLLCAYGILFMNVGILGATLLYELSVLACIANGMAPALAARRARSPTERRQPLALSSPARA